MYVARTLSPYYRLKKKVGRRSGFAGGYYWYVEGSLKRLRMKIAKAKKA